MYKNAIVGVIPSNGQENYYNLSICKELGSKTIQEKSTEYGRGDKLVCLFREVEG
jgi:hypothetical protein